MSHTSSQFDKAIASCSDIFFKKTQDYGTAWRVLRIISVVDQIFIKALRIRTIQDVGTQKVQSSKSGSPKSGPPGPENSTKL